MQPLPRPGTSGRRLVDKFVLSSEPDNKKREGVRIAMRYYELASQLWNNKADTGRNSFANSLKLGQVLFEDAELRSCDTLQRGVGALQQQVEHTRPKPSQQAQLGMLGYLMTGRLSMLWSCAAAKIDDLERAGS